MRRSRIDGNLTLLAILPIFWLWAAPAAAEPPPESQNSAPLELQTTWGLGLAPGAAFAGPENTSAPLTVWLSQSVRFPRYSQFGLELTFVAPGGLGATLLVDIIRTGRVRIHVLDPGIVWNLLGPISVGRVHRALDLTLGAGADIRLTRELGLTFGWRMYFPEPIGTISRNGDFARPVYAEAAKGGQLWIGLSRIW